MGPPFGIHRTAPRLRAAAHTERERCGSKEDMVDADEGGVEAEVEDITIAKSRTPTTTAMPAQSAK